MKKWFRFFFLSFFSHKTAKEGIKRGYTNVFLSFILALVFLFAGFVGAETLPFDLHYANSPDFIETVHAVFSNADIDKRIVAEIKNGDLKVKKHDGEFIEGLLINTFESDADKKIYSVNDYDIVVDSRPADTLAEVEAYCVSNDGKNTEISYAEYLSLSEVARLNFDFKLRYTGNELVLTDELIEEYRAYALNFSEESKEAVERISGELSESKITKKEYDRAIYELYFSNHYPDISAYESTSKVPLLRNYYYHQYLSKGINNYLLIFDDYMTGSFDTKNGIDVMLYGFYSNLDDGAIVNDGETQAKANAAVDDFIKNSFDSNLFLIVYAYMMNIISLIPFIALMLMVAALLSYSILKLRGVESITSLGAMLKIVGSFVWFSGAVAAISAIILAFFVNSSLINALTLVLFFSVLIIRAMVFIIKESELYTKQLELQESKQTEE